jgi:hypothetical protein
MVPMMTPPMQEAQVPRVVPASPVARLDVVPVHHADVFVRIERDAAFGTGIALGPEKFLPSLGEGQGFQSLPPSIFPIRSGVRV